MLRYKLIVCFLVFSGVAFGQCTFEHIYNYYLDVITHRTYHIQTNDGGFLTVMSCYDTVLSSGNTTDMAIVKIDSCGNILWKQHYGEPGINDDVSGCIEMQDGNLLIAGTTEKGPALANFRVIKLSKNGQLLWDSVYTGTHESKCMGITKRNNHNSALIYGYVWGKLDSVVTYTSYPLLIEIGNDGYTLKKKELKIPKFEYIINLIQPNDTIYDMFVVTYWDSLYFVQMDTAFNIKISKPLIYPYSRYLSSCLSKDSNSILLLADYNSATIPMKSTLFKIDLNGNIIKYINYFNPRVGDTLLANVYVVTATSDNGCLLGGSYFMKIDSNLNIQKIFWYNQTRCYLNSILQLPDNSIVGSGVSNLLDTANAELYIVKLNEKGEFAYLGIDETKRDKQTEAITIYPNPATSILNIQTSSNQKITAQLFDLTGKAVTSNISFTNNITINLQELSQGLYFVYIKDAAGSLIKTQKVSVIK